MKWIDTEDTKRIGFDFYCDVANQIVKAREDKGWTQKQLASETGIKLSKIQNIEALKIRIDLDYLEKLSKALERTIDWLIDAEFDAYGEKCLYIVYPEHLLDFKIYIEASSSRMAFLEYDRMLKAHNCKYDSPRERVFVELKGVPLNFDELKKKFKTRTEEDLPLEPDDEK